MRSTLEELAQRVDAQVIGDPQLPIDGVAGLRDAGPTDIAPLFELQQQGELRQSGAAALLVPARLRDHAAGLGRPVLLCQDPRRALGLLLEHLLAASERPSAGVHPTAIVDEAAVLHPSARVGPFCLLERGVRVDEGVELQAYCHVGADAWIERDCRVGSHAFVGAGCVVGAGSVLGPGSVLGAEGFGYWRDGQRWRRIPSAGHVTLGEGVEIGANTCVDRATLGSTRIDEGAKLDNLVQVGHNAQVGARALLCAQVGLAGSVEIGADTLLGGQVGVADHRRVGAEARIGAGSGVATDVAPGETVSGYPAFKHSRWLRSSVLFRRLDRLSDGLKQLALRVESLAERLQAVANSENDGKPVDPEG
jgi:UDP-3-O-[3-hydroxymyristoyl] glucosamine N-acyltransferase